MGVWKPPLPTWFRAQVKFYVPSANHRSHNHPIIERNWMSHKYPTSEMDSSPLPRWAEARKDEQTTSRGNRSQLTFFLFNFSQCITLNKQPLKYSSRNTSCVHPLHKVNYGNSFWQAITVVYSVLGAAGIDSDQVSRICRIFGHWTAMILLQILHNAAVAKHKPVRKCNACDRFKCQWPWADQISSVYLCYNHHRQRDQLDVNHLL